MADSTENIKFHKAGYDSRLHFSKFLVDLKEMILKSQMSSANDWFYSLRTFASHVMGFVEPKKLKEWFELYKEKKEKHDLSKQNNKYNSYNPESDLFNLQDILFEMSAPLFLPMGDDDDDDEDW